MLKEFEQELKASGYIHRPLPLHQERSLEAERQKKEVLARKALWDGSLLPEHEGIGTVEIKEGAGREGGNTVRVVAPTAKNFNTADAGDRYALSKAEITFKFPGDNWEDYNRVSFWVKPDSPGSHSVHFRVYVKNEGRFPIPDAYMREGQHLVNLVNHEWNQVIWEFAQLPRDVVTELKVKMDADGLDTSTGPYFQYDFEAFELQRIEKPEKEKGWTCDPDHISYSMSGYFTNGQKTAIANSGEDTFSVLDAKGNVILDKKVIRVMDTRGYFEILDFSEITTPGYYQLKCGRVTTSLFEIGPKVLESAVWKAINFIFCERCGYPVPGKHGRCHTDVISVHNGLTLSCGGGWHDAGDMSQQMLQTAEVAQEILELADQVKDDPVLYNRLMEEGLWGLEFTLKSRFGDGYRASSVGLGLWTNGFIGDADDVSYRQHNQAFQNFFCGAVEAQAAIVLKDYDPDLAWKCLDAAKQDYWFAKERYEKYGMEKPIMWEHTLNSGASQYYAAAVWAAASICQSEYSDEFAAEAKYYGEKLMACQETGTDGVPMKGFFYRDETHKEIVHFTHQGRDHSFVQALEALCRAFPDAPEKGQWENAMKLYGDYLKGLWELATPYGMIPAGIHSMTELDYGDTFALVHLLVDYETEKPNYEAQLKAGIDLGGGYYVRMFPVWFSFRGNAGIQLAMGKAAALLGKYFDDAQLKEIAVSQLYWMSGKNPFCQSLIYGEGERYAQQDANYPGEMVGEMPVGIETLENEDEPYWPSGNNATYKEVWLTPAGRWLGIMAELYPDMQSL